jgi:urease accessory protein
MVDVAIDNRVDHEAHIDQSNGTDSKNPKPLPFGTLATSNLHTLALLSDSALPLGSFAFSSGLESFLAHRRLDKTRPIPPEGAFQRFLKLSLSSLASTALPYVLAAHRHPENIEQLDNDFDASTPCTVARRASVAQGRALLSIWERCFVGHTDLNGDAVLTTAAKDLKSFAVQLKATGGQNLALNAHFAPLWGLITRLLGVDEQASAYLFLFSHARTITSAGVRASELGPYQAQSELASQSLRDHIEQLLLEHWDKRPEDAAQTVPALDLWVGRHEKLYSRIFNS